MKRAPLAFAVSTLASLAVLAPASVARAEDTVHVCIGASTEGQTLRKQGRLLASRDAMIACARDACPAIVRSHCARWLSEVDAAIPSIVVRAQDATGADVLGARLAIDGRPAKLDGQPVRLDPGEHTVAIESDHARKEEHVLLIEGESSRRVTLRFAAPPATPAAAPPLRDAPAAESHVEPARRQAHVPTGAWVLGGVGVASLGAATYFALAANSQLGDLKTTCSPHCSDAQTHSGRTDALLFDVFLGAGVAAVASALIWGLAFPSHSYAGTSVASADRATPRLELRPLFRGARREGDLAAEAQGSPSTRALPALTGALASITFAY
jgi:hypothetical protein